MSNNYNTAAWRAMRKEMLEEAICHWCKRAKATELDHLVEIDRGGTNSPDNLVPACKRCNSRRGAEYLAKKRAASVQARQKAMSQQNRKKTKNDDISFDFAKKNQERKERAQSSYDQLIDILQMAKGAAKPKDNYITKLLIKVAKDIKPKIVLLRKRIVCYPQF